MPHIQAADVSFHTRILLCLKLTCSSLRVYLVPLLFAQDESGEPFYYETASGSTSYLHPMDEYFMNKVCG